MDSLMLVFGLGCLGSFLLVLDHVSLGSFLSMSSPICLDEAMLLYDFANFRSGLPLRSYACLGFLLPVYGFACSGLPFSVLDFVHMELLLLLRSFGCLDSLASAYGISRLGHTSLALDPSGTGLASFSQNYLRVEFMIRSLLATLRLLLLGLLAVASKPHMLGKCVVGLWSSLFGAFAFGAGPRDHRQLLASTHTRAFGSGHAHLWNQLFGAFVADPGPYTP